MALKQHIAAANATPYHFHASQAVEQMLSFLDSSPLEVVRAALAPYCRRAGLPLPDSPAEGVRLAAGMANCKGEWGLGVPAVLSCLLDLVPRALTA